jgi:hypothetical protein
MQEVRHAAFIDQRHMLWKTLQERGADQFIEVRLAHVAK